jgi:hypothetical protein
MVKLVELGEFGFSGEDTMAEKDDCGIVSKDSEKGTK